MQCATKTFILITGRHKSINYYYYPRHPRQTLRQTTLKTLKFRLNLSPASKVSYLRLGAFIWVTPKMTEFKKSVVFVSCRFFYCFIEKSGDPKFPGFLNVCHYNSVKSEFREKIHLLCGAKPQVTWASNLLPAGFKSTFTSLGGSIGSSSELKCSRSRRVVWEMRRDYEYFKNYRENMTF